MADDGHPEDVPTRSPRNLANLDEFHARLRDRLAEQGIEWTPLVRRAIGHAVRWVGCVLVACQEEGASDASTVETVADYISYVIDAELPEYER